MSRYPDESKSITQRRAYDDVHLVPPPYAPACPLDVTEWEEHIAFRDFILGQGEVWVDAGGNVHAISKMSRRYCLNVLCFLHDHLGPEHCAYTPLTDALRARILPPSRWRRLARRC